MSNNKLLNKPTGGYLEGQLLIATPLIMESCFNHAVLYLCAHSHEGAMGIIINRVVDDLSYADVLKQLKIPAVEGGAKWPVYLGGPVEASRGLVIHTPDYKHADTVVLSPEIAVTSNLQILRDITSGTGPKKHLLALGYAGWAKGQLEAEIEANSWISAPANGTLVFDTPDNDKWDKTARTLGIDMMKLSGDVGHA